MNTALDDLHGDLVTLEDNEIINNSDHSSSHSTSHEEEDEEEDDTEDIELIEKRSAIKSYQVEFIRKTKS
ncbi:ASB_collapsed_G0021270.mRNA.1.CDS.1 [Saccharomyces cerevisiae]|nr:ASB_collapsed_G0021270.mRNA.1.CDS.1 [Saccharomyces cerevisiae]